MVALFTSSAMLRTLLCSGAPTKGYFLNLEPSHTNAPPSVPAQILPPESSNKGETWGPPPKGELKKPRRMWPSRRNNPSLDVPIHKRPRWSRSTESTRPSNAILLPSGDTIFFFHQGPLSQRGRTGRILFCDSCQTPWPQVPK